MMEFIDVEQFQNLELFLYEKKEKNIRDLAEMFQL